MFMGDRDNLQASRNICVSFLGCFDLMRFREGRIVFFLCYLSTHDSKQCSREKVVVGQFSVQLLANSQHGFAIGQGGNPDKKKLLVRSN